MPKAAAVEPGNIRYQIVMAEDQGGFHSSALTHQTGTVISTVNAYDGERDLAIIDVPEGDREYFESMLDDDENVLSYRPMNEAVTAKEGK